MTLDQAELIPTTASDVERLAQRVATTRRDLAEAADYLKTARSEHKAAKDDHDQAVAQFCEARTRLARQNGEQAGPERLDLAFGDDDEPEDDD